jgi:hypothetical protein
MPSFADRAASRRKFLQFLAGSPLLAAARSAGLVIDTVVCPTLAKWETVSGRFGAISQIRPDKLNRPIRQEADPKDFEHKHHANHYSGPYTLE